MEYSLLPCSFPTNDVDSMPKPDHPDCQPLTSLYRNGDREPILINLEQIDDDVESMPKPNLPETQPLTSLYRNSDRKLILINLEQIDS